MRRILLLATTLLLPGCSGSGFYSYLGNTISPPFGANPNKAPGSGENYQKVVAAHATEAAPPPILFQAGDVWPAPPKPPPTLRDLQAQQANEMKGGTGYAPLQPLPNLPGYEVPAQQSSPYVPGSALPRGTIKPPLGGPVGTGGGDLNSLGPNGNGTIVVPNGNGTSTVISPNGAVTTVPTPGK